MFMAKICFKDYLDNYEEIKNEEKKAKKVKELKHQKELAEEINQKYFELKEYLEILKRNLNTSSMSETEVKNNIIYMKMIIFINISYVNHDWIIYFFKFV